MLSVLHVRLEIKFYLILSYLKNLSVEEMTWHQTGDKPLTEPVMTHFNGACIRHQAWVCWLVHAGIPKDMFTRYKEL